jgi:photosystem II stability/assembly factor-like uncharacterized protein
MVPSHRLYVGTIGEGLWRSTDGGESFLRACDGMFVECHVRALAVHPLDPQTLYLGTEQGLFRSCDGAGRWSRVESPLNGKQIWSIAQLPDDPNVVLAGTCPSALYRSTDGGATWEAPFTGILQECPRIMHTRVTTLVVDPVERDVVWAGVEIDGIFRSQDRGKNWQRVPAAGISSRDIHALAIVHAGPGAIRMLAATNNDLNLSDDRGQTWRPLRIGEHLPWFYCRTLAQSCGQPSVLLLGMGDAPPGTVGLVARSEDGGCTWEQAEMPGKPNSTMWNFATHPADANLVYASSVSGEVYRSDDAGRSWHKLTREFGEIRALAWTP